MHPTHIADIEDRRAALAPYNFVPLPERVVPAPEVAPEERVEPVLDGQGRAVAEFPFAVRQDTYHRNRHTGRIVATLTTESPLYVRCGLTPEQLRAGLDAKDLPDFFYLQNTGDPVIPGSSLRGMLRALVEIAGYGKIDRVTDRPRFFYRAVASRGEDPLAKPYRSQLRAVKAGVITREGEVWQIKPARPINGETYIKVRERDIPRQVGLIRLNDAKYHLQVIRVSFTVKRLKPSDRAPQGRTVIDLIDLPGVHPEQGWLVTAGNMLETGKGKQPSLRKNHVVVPDPGDTAIPIDPTAIDDYLNGLSDFQLEQLGEMGVLQEGRPAFYCEPARGEPGVIAFGHSPNFRLPFRFPNSKRAATPRDFVPEALRDEAVVDLAEAIFGFVRHHKQEGAAVQAMAGRVFVGDATLDHDQEEIWYGEEPITPRILASPKPTTFQHYLTQPASALGKLAHYGSRPEEDTVVRGHKLYWHKGADPAIGLPEEQAKINETQKTLIRPVRAGVSFTFTVHFENLSDIELGALLWVLQIAADDRYRLKLGMGKPIGLGSVKISSQVYPEDRRGRYTSLFAGEGWATGAADNPLGTEAQQPYLAAFHRHVLSQSGEPVGYTRIEETLRIRCLLALLRWHGPDPADTRYLEIERVPQKGVIAAAEVRGGSANEYKQRPVLPSPLQVIGEQLPTNPVLPIHRPERSQPEPSANQLPARPTGPTLPAIGDVFTGLVLERDEELVVIEVPGSTKAQAVALLQVEPTTPKWVPGKDRARVEVVSQRKHGERTILTVRRAPAVPKK